MCLFENKTGAEMFLSLSSASNTLHNGLSEFHVKGTDLKLMRLNF